jgi:hypothetical protein
MKFNHYRENALPVTRPPAPTRDDVLAGLGFVLCLVLICLL